MPYYIRILAERDEPISLSSMKSLLETENVDGDIDLEEGSEDNWEQVVLQDSTGQEVAIVERSVVSSGSQAEEELGRFAEEIKVYRPASASKWLLEYFPKVKAIYAFQILDFVEDGNGWAVLATVHQGVKERLGGIVQADGAGFSNTDGHHILWQFADTVEGLWAMAVLNEGGEWECFEMELGDPDHREAFLSGKVPKGVKRLRSK